MHPVLTRYLMLMLPGLAAYFQFGQDEDPLFTFRVMVERTFLAGRHCPASCRAGHVQAETHAGRGIRTRTTFTAFQGSVNSKLISRSKTLSARGRDQHLVRGA